MSLSDKALRLVRDEMEKIQQPAPVETPVDLRAHRAACAHLEACFEALDNEEVEVETMAPFCGCTDCVVREVLFAAYPILMEDKGDAASV